MAIHPTDYAPTVVSTMLGGHLVDVEVIRADPVEPGSDRLLCRFLRHHDSGSERLCLDYGAGWNIAKGDTCHTRPAQILRAADLIAEARKAAIAIANAAAMV